MAITNAWRIGKTRRKLALLLEKSLGVTVRPEDVESQYPYYATEQMDGCSWMGHGTDPVKGSIYFYSYNTMTECARYGIEVEYEESHRCEIFAQLPA